MKVDGKEQLLPCTNFGGKRRYFTHEPKGHRSPCPYAKPWQWGNNSTGLIILQPEEDLPLGAKRTGETASWHGGRVTQLI